MSGENIAAVQPGCLPGCTTRHATTVSGCEVTTKVGAVKALGEPDLVVHSNVGAEGTWRYTEITVAVDDPEQAAPLLVLDADQALELAALLVAACDQAAQITVDVTEQLAAGGPR
ncbi:hypothetical protein [Lentzea flava]|uniref:Uncharacterized protein n=1 Tax=Lentzea flava TaxID=103732 RepID=A0ABQ2V1H6_9PSEU|nr:hypothetical protein [Lentzea flava]MCP2202730.1 hypothetical protein [Lentzea flava]GGU61595.1 hypothetical protein GCM10010178_62200 [Lentzea flava]